MIINNLQKENPFVKANNLGRHNVTTLMSTEADDISTGGGANANNANNATKETLELNDNVKKIIKLLIKELRKTLTALLDSSQDIERIFRMPLIQLTGERITFNMENIHKEEFCNVLAQDEFLSVKNCFNLDNFTAN
jgi:hypothetical protein